MYFRYMDQSDPAVQSKMLRARDAVLAAEYVSSDLSPSFTWLEAFQVFVAERDPASVTEDGSVAQAAFHDELSAFLTQMVRAKMF